jgi:predicted small secreted protein
MNPIFFTRSLSCIKPKAKGLVLVCGLLLAATCFSVTSCGTARGFGSDVHTAGRGIERTGEKIQEKAER